MTGPWQTDAGGLFVTAAALIPIFARSQFVMRKQFMVLSLVAMSFIVNSISVRAEWPARVFAPYMYIGSDDKFKLTDCDDQCRQKFYTLAFIIARMDGHGPEAVYHKEPSWDGRIPIEENLYHDQIDAIRARGG